MSTGIPMVVKVQRSLTPSGPTEVLVYDSTRKYRYQGDLTPELDKMFGNRLKLYCLAMLVPNEDEPDSYHFSLTQEVEEQSW